MSIFLGGMETLRQKWVWKRVWKLIEIFCGYGHRVWKRGMETGVWKRGMETGVWKRGMETLKLSIGISIPH